LTEKTTPPALKNKVATGYRRLDDVLQGGFLEGSATVLSAPASDEVPILLRDFVQAMQDTALLICRTLSSAETIAHESTRVKALVCSDKPVPPTKNVIPGRGIDNLTDVNFQITDALGSVQPKRVALDILSDVLLRHKGLQTRKWLTELLERLRSKNITTLAVFNPYMHPSEDVQAVVDLFDGNLEIVEEKVGGTLRKILRVRWMHGVEVAEKEFPLEHLTAEQQTHIEQETVSPTPLNEPRWLTPLISRVDEFSKLKTAFDNALTSRGSVVALQGETGVGKTRLMQELAVYAKSKNALVLSGNASEDAGAYAPWIEATRQYIGQAPGELLRRMLGPNASELVKLVPDLAAKVGTIPPSKALGEQQDKLRFYEAVTQFLMAISKESPLLLSFDDMQYADQPSLELLEYFVRSASSLRVLSVCSVPAEYEVQSDSPLQTTLLKFNKQRLLETVAVKNLSKEATTNLIQQVFGEQIVSPEFVDLIYQRTAGNPFFVEEVLHSLVEDGTIFRTEKGWDRKPIQEIVLPQSVKAALKSRIAKLGPEKMKVLTIAAIIGSEFYLNVLREMTQTEEDALLDTLEGTVTAGLISEVPGPKDMFRFTDSRVRQVLLGDLLQARRIRYHAKAGEAMEKVFAEGLVNHAEAIATQYHEAGNTEKTIKYSLMAGGWNRKIHAYEQAVRDFERVFDLMELEGERNEVKGATLEKLGENYCLAGRAQEGVKSYEQALAIFTQLNDFKACARICVVLSDELMLARSGGEMVGIREAIEVLKRGLKYVEETPQSFEAAAIYSRLAWFLGLSEERNEVLAWAEKGLEAGEKSNNFETIAMTMANKGALLCDTGKVDEGLPLWEKALEVSMQHEQYMQAFRTLLNLSVYWYPKDLARARGFMSQRVELATSLNDVMMHTTSLAWLSFFDTLKGDLTLAREEVRKAFETWERLGMREKVPIYYEARRARLEHVLGGGSLQFESSLHELAKRDSAMSSAVELNLELGILRWEQGRLDEAKGYFESSVDTFKDAEFSTQPLLHIETLAYLTSLYAKEGRLDEARKDSEWAMRLAETLKSDAGLALALQSSATLLLATGDSKGAEEAYLKCLGLWEKAGWPYYQANALVAFSNALARTNPEESKKRLLEAAEIFKKLGAKQDLERAEAKLKAT
jgi:predicted ATPase